MTFQSVSYKEFIYFGTNKLATVEATLEGLSVVMTYVAPTLCSELSNHRVHTGSVFGLLLLNLKRSRSYYLHKNILRM